MIPAQKMLFPLSLIAVLLLALCGNASAVRGPFDYYNKATHPDPWLLGNVREYHIKPARKYILVGRYRDAEADARFVLARFPNHPEALDLLSQVAKKIDRISIAEEAFNQAFRIYPNATGTLVAYAKHLLRHKQYQASIDNYLKGMEAGHENAQIHYNLGLAYFGVGDFENANEQAQIAYRQGYPLPGLRNKLQREGKWDAAAGPTEAPDGTPDGSPPGTND